MARGVQIQKMNTWKKARVLDAFFREKRQEALSSLLIAKSAMAEGENAAQDVQSTIDDYMDEMFPNKKGSEDFYEEHEEIVREELQKEYKVRSVSEKSIQQDVRKRASEMGGVEDIEKE